MYSVLRLRARKGNDTSENKFIKIIGEKATWLRGLVSGFSFRV